MMIVLCNTNVLTNDTNVHASYTNVLTNNANVHTSNTNVITRKGYENTSITSNTNVLSARVMKMFSNKVTSF